MLYLGNSLMDYRRPPEWGQSQSCHFTDGLWTGCGTPQELLLSSTQSSILSVQNVERHKSYYRVNPE